MEQARNGAIDRMRGLAVFMMAAANYLSEVAIVPAWLKHAPDIGLTVTDTIAPFFVFAIGLTYGASFRRRAARDKACAYGHFATRYLALLGIGALLSAGGSAIAGIPSDWGVLQAIGVAGLLCLLLIRFSPLVRMGAGVLALTAYQIILDRWMLKDVLAAAHGGLFGALSWGAMLILATAMADVREKGVKPYALCCAAVSALAAASALLTPVSKHRVSASFVLVTLAIAGWLYLAIDAATKNWKMRGVLCWAGENPLALYVLHMLLLAFAAVPRSPGWYVGAPAWLAAIQLGAIFGMLIFAARQMHKRKIILKL